MLFNSYLFAVFFPLVFVLYWILPHRFRWILLLTASYFFYMCWEARYALLILGSTALDYAVSLRMLHHPPAGKGRRRLLWLSLAGNLGLLFSFKYYNFSASNLNALFESLHLDFLLPISPFLLPMGISFYTFQTLSYTIDVYRGHLEPEKDFFRFALYVSFFPQLVAGPIERATNLLPQFAKTMRFDYEKFVYGMKLMIWGFFLKVVVADRLSIYVNHVYSNPHNFQGGPLFLATYFFSFQIYADFAGYSAIAIGTGKMLGFDLMTNFRHPYLAASVSEFWKRWHISLSTWFQDYVYIPLGGNRVTRGIWARNIVIVFVVSGFWHGADWRFIIWGALHGFYLVAGYYTLAFRNQLASLCGFGRFPKIANMLSVMITYHLVLLAWVFFAAQSTGDALLILKNMAAGLPQDMHRLIQGDFRYLYLSFLLFVKISKMEFVLSILLVVLVFLHDLLREWNRLPRWLGEGKLKLSRLAFYDFLILAMLLFGIYGQTKFIYFQF